jgi:uncharacterized protein
MTTGTRAGWLPIDARSDRSYEMAPNIEEVPMPASTVASIHARRAALLAAAVLLAANAARAEPAASSAPEARVVVTGDGSVSVAPDYAQIRSGVTTRAKTVKEAVDANSKLMAAVTAALRDSGIAEKDIQTSRFTIQPIYDRTDPRAEQRLTGYSVANQVSVIIRQIGKVGDVLDRLVAAGATDVGNIAFLVSDPSKALDQAREAAIADARRKAEVYAKAAGVRLGPVQWITEDTGGAPGPVPMMRAAAAAPVPIATGEDTLRARVTVGFDIAR